MRQNISQTQINLLEKAKIFLRARDMRSPRHGVTDPENYLSVWAPGSLGNLRIHCLLKARWISKDIILTHIRNIRGLGYEADMFLDQVNPNFKYDRLAISWCVESDFLQDSAIQSRYFDCTTRDLDGVLWVMLPLDRQAPTHKNDNIVLLNRNRLEKFSILHFLKNVFFCLSKGISLSVDGLFAQKFVDEILAKTNVISVKALLMPYEGQPWQHTLCWNIKNRSKNIHIIGDLHSCLPPLPTDFIKRCGAPDALFMHGAGQKRIMLASLGWRDGDIKVVPSLRFGKHDSADLRNKILLPYSFRDSALLLKQLDFFLKNFGKDIVNLDIRNHPAQSASPAHLALIKGIQGLQEKYKDNNKASRSDAGVVLVIGASSAIIECLEQGMKVFQITEDPVFESFGPEIWKGLHAEYINENIVEYSLQGKPSYLEFGESNLKMMFDHA